MYSLRSFLNPYLKTLRTALHRGLLIASGALLLACGAADEGGVNPEVASRSLVPADENLAAIYNRSCRSCHTVAGTRSPLTGDTAAWAPRLEKGMDTLVDNVVNGYNGMPPMGLCMDCDASQFEALIRFMAEGK